MLSLRSVRMGQVLAQGETVPSSRMMDEITGGHPNALPRRDCPQHNPDTCSGPQTLRNSSTTSFVPPHPQGDCRSSTEETSAKSGKEPARPKVKLRGGQTLGTCQPPASLRGSLPCSQAPPSETHLGKSRSHLGLSCCKCANCEMLALCSLGGEQLAQASLCPVGQGSGG